MEKLRLVLKRRKPELLMLAENKATWPSTFEERFDAAYDWMPEESWVSHWSCVTLPGIPMMYNGQEVGKDTHPYNTNFVFFPSQTIKYWDTYVDEEKVGGTYSIFFNADKIASGLYIYRLQNEDEMVARKMMLIK